MRDEIVIFWAEPIVTAVIRDLVRPRDLPRFVPAACAEAMSIHRASGRGPAGRMLARYREDGNTEAGVEVRHDTFVDPRLCRSHLPAGWVAHAVHRGTYDRLGETHRAMQNWCTARGHRGGAERWEIFAPWQDAWDANPAAVRTDVYHWLGSRPETAPRRWAWGDPRLEGVGSAAIAESARLAAGVIESVHLIG